MEHDPQTRTILQTQAGTRTFEASEVVFAGLAARDPGPPATAMSGVPPAASGGPPQVPSSEPPKASALETSSSDKKVHLRADRENVRYYLLALSGTSTARQALTPACVAPCDVPLERGAYRVALGFGNQKPLVVRGSLELKEGATVEGRVLSRHLTRAAGWTLMGVSTVPLVYGIVTALASSGERKGLGPVIALGGVGGMGGGFVLTRGEDIAEASVVDERPARGASATQGPMSGSGASRFGTSVGGQF